MYSEREITRERERKKKKKKRKPSVLRNIIRDRMFYVQLSIANELPLVQIHNQIHIIVK